jgi:hypothetical protein
MCYTPDGIALTPSHLKDLLVTAGFADIEERELIPKMTRVLTARRP